MQGVATPSEEFVESCDLCGASLRDASAVSGLEKFPVMRCACGLVVTNPRPRVDALNDVYPADYYAHTLRPKTPFQKFTDKLKVYKCGYPTSDGALTRLGWRITSAVLGRLILFQLPYVGEGRKLLDIGCGSGDMLDWARQHSWDVYGLEFDAPAVEIAHQRGLTQVQCGTLETVAFPDESFDAITMFQVLEHVPSPRCVLNKCQRMLKPDGYFIVAVPNFSSYARRIACEMWHGFDIPKHLYHFNESTLRRFADACGFSVTATQYWTAPVALLMNVRSWQSVRRQIPGYSIPDFRRRVLASVSDRELRAGDVMLLVMRKKQEGLIAAADQT